MTPERMLAAGQAETFKGSVHLALFSLAAVCTAYNVGALLSRPTRQLACNTLVYTGLMALEARQTFKHWSQPADAEAPASSKR